jgi:hypothetical protein
MIGPGLEREGELLGLDEGFLPGDIALQSVLDLRPRGKPNGLDLGKSDEGVAAVQEEGLLLDLSPLELEGLRHEERGGKGIGGLAPGKRRTLLDGEALLLRHLLEASPAPETAGDGLGFLVGEGEGTLLQESLADLFLHLARRWDHLRLAGAHADDVIAERAAHDI